MVLEVLEEVLEVLDLVLEVLVLAGSPGIRKPDLNKGIIRT